MVLLLVTSLASAGYGDAVDGVPSPEERALALWTNAVRVAPETFRPEFEAGGCSFDRFQDYERTPQAPLLWNPDLAEAARFHTEDMFATGKLSHQSSDGTSMADRVSRFYAGPGVGENVASGYTTGWAAVMSGWMCSDGHRANIMRPMFTELGTGQVAAFYTQNFGSRVVDHRGIGVGARSQEGGRQVFRGDFHDASGAAPDRYVVVWNGVPFDMTLDWGRADQGIYRVGLDSAASPSETGCDEWYLEAERGGSIVRYPETGSWGWGDCDFADTDARWIDTQLEPDLDEGGCSSTGTGAAPTLALLALGLVGLRRRRD